MRSAPDYILTLPEYAMKKSKMHKSYCSAGEPAPCTGYFENDVLPCTCGATQPILEVLSQVVFPAAPLAELQTAAALALSA
jgi:hypothetical protein